VGSTYEEEGLAVMKKLLLRLRASTLATEGAATDLQLLAAYRDRRDEAAFEALVRRHGPMVLGVCRRVLGSEADAEDAFQATFLVLVRRAGSVKRPGRLPGWLYGVAYRTALKARTMNARRRAREGRAARPAVSPGETAHDLLPLLDQELARLPEKYRAPVVLCELEGKSRKEAAGLLGVREGTLSSRLAHARKLLARRLSGHGAAVTVGALAAVLTPDVLSAGAPAPLVAAAARAAAGTVTAEVAALTQEVLKTMLLTKLKLVSLAVLAGCLLVGGALLYAAQDRGAADGSRPGQAAPEVKKGQAGSNKSRLRPGDDVYIRALNTLPDNPLDGVFRVEESGTVALGPAYGRVSIQGLTVEEAEAAVRKHLSNLLRDSQVSLTRYTPVSVPDLERRVRRLEHEVQALRAAVESLRKKP
jgi:RNA polymerase sigma factor (sigma-70 family)